MPVRGSGIKDTVIAFLIGLFYNWIFSCRDRVSPDCYDSPQTIHLLYIYREFASLFRDMILNRFSKTAKVQNPCN